MFKKMHDKNVHHLVTLDMEFPDSVSQCGHWLKRRANQKIRGLFYYFTCYLLGVYHLTCAFGRSCRQQLSPQLHSGTWLDHRRWSSGPLAMFIANMMSFFLLHCYTTMATYMCVCVPLLTGKPAKNPPQICLLNSVDK